MSSKLNEAIDKLTTDLTISKHNELRDAFAMNAMTGLMLRGMPIAPGEGGSADLVRVSYEIADEMLKQRETNTNES